MSNYVNLLDIVYPVGSIYHSMNSISPATIIGGTWTAIKTFLLGSTTSGKTAEKKYIRLPLMKCLRILTRNMLQQTVVMNQLEATILVTNMVLFIHRDAILVPRGGASTQQYAALHDLLHLVQNSLVVLKANLLSEVAYV